jgi:hypothetical protein
MITLAFSQMSYSSVIPKQTARNLVVSVAALHSFQHTPVLTVMRCC